jgi:hypothetical protein
MMGSMESSTFGSDFVDALFIFIGGMNFEVDQRLAGFWFEVPIMDAGVKYAQGFEDYDGEV